jgi:hypothetical protein
MDSFKPSSPPQGVERGGLSIPLNGFLDKLYEELLYTGILAFNSIEWILTTSTNFS